MVFISMESLEKIQQLHQYPPMITAKSKKNALPPTSENTESANNSVQRPEILLSRFDMEMSHILNSPLSRDENKRWKMYREILWRYLYFIQKAQRQNDVLAENENENDTRSIAGETTLDDIFRDLSRITR